MRLLLLGLAACQYSPTASAELPDPDAADVADAPPDTAVTTDGPIDVMPPPTNIIEAEAFTTNNPGVDRTWAPATTFAGFSGTGYMLCGPGNGTFCPKNAGLDACAASLDYTLTIPAAGTYHVHVRALAINSADDSAYYGIDDVVALDDLNMLQDSTWRWLTGQTSYVLTAGAHKLTIWQRECGSKIDVVAVTTSATPPP